MARPPFSFLRDFFRPWVRLVFFASLGLAPTLAADPATPAAWQPDRPIRILVYMSPGGLIDYTARKFADVARKYSDQPLIIINKPGAGGIVAIEEFLQGPADGHLILAVTRSNVAKLIEARREELFDGLDWFALLINDPECVIVDRRSQAHDWASLRAENEARAGNQAWPGPAIGGLDHLFALKLWEKTGMSGRWIPYQSGGQAMAALMGGFGSAYVGNPYDLRGKPHLGIAAISGHTRYPQFPDVPTFLELGIEGLENETMWRGFAVRDTLPEGARQWWHQLFLQVSSDPAWFEEWTADAIDPRYVEREEFNRMVTADREEFAERLRGIGLVRNEVAAGWLTRRTTGVAARVWLALALGLNLTLAWVLGRTRWRTRRGELGVVIAIGSVAGLFLLLSTAIPPANQVDLLGPRGVPRLWITALGLLLVGQLMFLLRAAPPADSTQQTPAAHSPDADSSQGSLRGLGFGGLLLGYVATLPVLGYWVCTVVFIPAALWWLGARRVVNVAVLTLAWLGFAWWVFEGMLNVPLPHGWWARLINQGGGG